MTNPTDNAKILEILLWYDQPEIVLLQKNSVEFILAVSDVTAEEGVMSFIGASMTLDKIEEYQLVKFDLRFALSHANLRRYWRFEFDGYQDIVDLKKIKKSADNISASLPDSGFFSRDHRRIEVVRHKTPDAIESFEIDGGWDLGEFSSFYSQVEDIYYIFNDIILFENSQTALGTKNTIKRAFERSWGGGGSYVAFYNKIANDNSHTAPLRVSGIQYNSPGYVAVKAKKKPFDNLIALVQSYADRGLETRKAYNALYKFMSFSGLFKAEGERAHLTSVSREDLEKLSNGLAAFLPGISFSSLLAMSDGNLVVAAKVLMSIKRRVEKLYQFFDEGRVTYDGIDTSSIVDDEIQV